MNVCGKRENKTIKYFSDYSCVHTIAKELRMGTTAYCSFSELYVIRPGRTVTTEKGVFMK